MAVIAEAAPAKVNLTLRVTGRRANGYHGLESLVVFADAADRLTLDPGRPDGFSIAGPAAAGIDGPNLAARVLAMAQRVAPDLAFGHLHLDKHLPIAAGIGGGSADAAAVLRLLLSLHPGEPRLAALALDAVRIGADVPACLVSRALVMRGIGEAIVPLRHLAPVEVVLVNPRLPLATAAVFAALAAGPEPAQVAPLAWPEAIDGLDALLDLITDRGNDLEPPARALLPVIGDVLESLTGSAGCRLARMSGSGATCFGLFASREDAEAAVSGLTRTHPSWWITAATLG